MKYRFSNAEYGIADEDGKQQIYKICDCCGKYQQSNFGYEIEYAAQGSSFSTRRGYCQRCANEIAPYLQACIKALDRVHKEMAEEHKDEPKSEKQIYLEQRHNEFSKRIMEDEWNTIE